MVALEFDYKDIAMTMLDLALPDAVFAREEESRNALLIALIKGNREAAKLIASKDCLPGMLASIVFADGNNLLALAASLGDIDTAEWIA